MLRLDTAKNFVTILGKVVEVYIIIIGLVEYIDNIALLPTTLPLEFFNYVDITLTNNSRTLLDYKRSSYAIKLKLSTLASFSPLYNLSLKELGILCDYLAEA